MLFALSNNFLTMNRALSALFYMMFVLLSHIRYANAFIKVSYQKIIMVIKLFFISDSSRVISM